MADNIPEGLDDLLNSIGGEGKSQKSSAIVVVPKAEKKDADLVDEDIDSRILRLLGLEDVFDIDYDTYKSLLKERMVAGRMPGTQIPTEETELLTEEYKRIKSKTGRFKVKSQKIKAETFVGKKKTATQEASVEKSRPSIVPKYPALPGTVPEEEEVKPESAKNPFEDLVNKVSEVNNNVKSIINSLSKRNKEEKKKEEEQRLSIDRQKKVQKENREERKKSASKIPSVLKKALKPVKGILDILGDLFKRIALGTLIMEIIRFLEDPAKYFQSMVDWLNGLIERVEDGIKDIVNNILVKPINTQIEKFNAGLNEIIKQINEAFNKIPFVDIPDIPQARIPLVPSIGKDVKFIPRITMGNPFGEPKSPKSEEVDGTEGPVRAESTPTNTIMQQSSSNLFELIAGGEGGIDSVNRGTAGDTPGGVKSVLGKSSAELTVDEVHSAQQAGKIFAIGKYQITPVAMPGFRRWLQSQGIDTSTTKFNEATQDKYKEYTVNVKRPDVGRYLTGAEGSSLEKAQMALAAEFASVGVPRDMKKGEYGGGWPRRDIKKGESLYSGAAGNRASISPEKVEAALDAARQMGQSNKSNTNSFVPSSSSNLIPSNTNEKPIAEISPTPTKKVNPPLPPNSGYSMSPIALPITPPNSGGTRVSSSGAHAGQKTYPRFSATDGSNSTLLSVKSLYNIVE